MDSPENDHDNTDVVSMEITLSIIGTNTGSFIQPTHTFTTRGGLIGRSDDCDWRFPVDQSIGPRHAKILYADGEFLLKGLIANGLLLKHRNQVLEKGKPHPIRHGDCFLMGNYHVLAKYHADTFSTSRLSTPWASADISSGHCGMSGLAEVKPACLSGVFAEINDTEFEMLAKLLDDNPQSGPH
ncbi:FHA domain-containing protein [Hahella ganghwensis]|uniref:FHA domain-containing protein n=1 Tax=Hahella ganghwensis TaxID=286420 RepID=UPI00036C71CD|nr:FHA domain-containing protein [Hahella ganghwensis]